MEHHKRSDDDDERTILINLFKKNIAIFFNTI